MKTQRLTTDKKDIEKAAGLIKSGKLVAFPTETVYGLGANALDADAVKSVYEAKGRPQDNPMIVHISNANQLPALIENGKDGIGQDAIKLMEAFWPGPLTMIFKKSSAVPDATTGGLDTVAIRMPSNHSALQLIDLAGVPVAAPSANASGKPSPTTADDVLEDMDGKISAIIMGEQSNVGIESTVVDLTGKKPMILRPGFITAEWMSNVLGKEVGYDKHLVKENESPKSPGMKYQHYSPKARVRLIESDGEDFQKKALVLAREARENNQKTAILNYGEDSKKAAHQLFADLRELDRQGYDIILIKALSQEGLGFSVMNRMLKSAGYDIIKEN